MELRLTVYQRWGLVQAVGEVRGTLAQVRLGGRALDALEFGEEERAAIGMETADGMVRWAEEREQVVELPDECVGLVRGAAEGWPGWMVERRREVEAVVEALTEDG